MKTLKEILADHYTVFEYGSMELAVKEWLEQFIIPNATMVHSQHQNECIRGLIAKLQFISKQEGKQ